MMFQGPMECRRHFTQFGNHRHHVASPVMQPSLPEGPPSLVDLPVMQPSLPEGPPSLVDFQLCLPLFEALLDVSLAIEAQFDTWPSTMENLTGDALPPIFQSLPSMETEKGTSWKGLCDILQLYQPSAEKVELHDSSLVNMGTCRGIFHGLLQRAIEAILHDCPGCSAHCNAWVTFWTTMFNQCAENRDLAVRAFMHRNDKGEVTGQGLRIVIQPGVTSAKYTGTSKKERRAKGFYRAGQKHWATNKIAGHGKRLRDERDSDGVAYEAFEASRHDVSDPASSSV